MKRERVRDQPAFLLHAVPYGETSLVLELFTAEYGRVAALAKGAKRPRSALRAVLLQFQPLRVSFSGKAELRTLTGAEWVGGLLSPRGDALLCAFYMNELILKLLAREDAHPVLFEAYSASLAQMSTNASLDNILRRFEWSLLRETGYAPDLLTDVEQRPVKSDLLYQWHPESGFVLSDIEEASVSGQTLLEIADHEYLTENSRQQAKQLTRRILNHCLGGQALNTRRILRDLHRR